MRKKINWQERVHHFLLSQEVKKKTFQRGPKPFNEMERIGIIYDATDASQKELTKRFISNLEKQNKQVKSLAFFDDKNEHSNESFKHFNRKDLNWSKHPKHPYVKDFVTQPFDLLICIYQGVCFPLEYLAALSPADLRVGPFTKRIYCYDVMVETKFDAPFETFLDQINSLLVNTLQTQYEKSPV